MATGLAPGFAFAAGVATFFAPCAFPLLPGYVAFYLGSDDDARGVVGRLRRATVVGALTSAGFLLVYGVLAGVVAAAGAGALRDVALLEPVVGALLLVLGAATVAGYAPTSHVPLPTRRRSAAGFLGFGVVYGAAAAGCTAPVFVAVALVALSGTPTAALVTLGAYAAGMVAMMLVVTALSALGRDRLLRVLSRSTGTLSRASGALLALAGVAQIYLWYFDFDPLGGLRALGLL
jgi:cytochrome c-type biogenesis protein